MVAAATIFSTKLFAIGRARRGPAIIIARLRCILRGLAFRTLDKDTGIINGDP